MACTHGIITTVSFKIRDSIFSKTLTDDCKNGKKKLVGRFFSGLLTALNLWLISENQCSWYTYKYIVFFSPTALKKAHRWGSRLKQSTKTGQIENLIQTPV